MKRLLAFVIALLLVFTLIGCNGQESSSAPPVQTTKPVPGETTGADPEPSGDDEIDWNNLSDEELYEMAKEEGGIINVYAGSGKMLKTGKAFLAKYPDLKLEVYDLDQDEARARLKPRMKPETSPLMCCTRRTPPVRSTMTISPWDTSRPIIPRIWSRIFRIICSPTACRSILR